MSRTRARLRVSGAYEEHASLLRTAAGAVNSGGAARKTWYRIENAAADRASVYLYDEIGGWGVYAEEFVAAAAEITAKQIDLHVNSPGGSVWDGLAIMAYIANHSAHWTAHVDGIAGSAASFLIQAADRIQVNGQSQIMIHNASGCCCGEAKDMRAAADVLDSISSDIAQVYHEASGTPVATWLERMAAETWYTGEAAVAAGLADEHVPTTRRREGREDSPESKTGLGAGGVPRSAVPEPDDNGGDEGHSDDELPDADLSALGDVIRSAVAPLAEPDPPAWDRDVFRAAVEQVANDMPALSVPSDRADKTDGEFTPIGQPAFVEAIRKGLYNA